MASSRQYDVVLLGATGYTGKLTAEHLHQKLPSNYKWAIAGRSESKLQNVNSTLKSLPSNRTTPDILTANLELSELTTLARRTRVLINCIGPYYLYSTPVVEACAKSGTHYLDVNGETPWVKEIIDKYEAAAKQSGAILIPSAGVESAPSDILAYTATKLIRDVWDCGVMDMVGSIHEAKVAGASGGTLATGIGITEHYPLSFLRKTMGNPFALSPISSRDHRQTKYPVPISYERTILQKLTGVWTYPWLGTLTTSITATPNVAIVHRSAGLNQSFYSYNFTYEEYMRVSSAAVGYLIHFALTALSLLLVLPPARFLIRQFVTAPGSGPNLKTNFNGYLELRGIAVAEQLNEKPRRALASFRFEGGSAYEWTAITVGEAAVALLESVDELKGKFGPGFLTPACLGDRYVARLEGAGVKIAVRQIGESGSK